MRIQRMVRSRFVRRYMREWKRHRAAVRLQSAARVYIARRVRAARKIQKMVRPKVNHWARQRVEAKRLMHELSDMLETTREAQARQAFAWRYDAGARDVDEVSEEEEENEDNAMGAYLDGLRRAAGLID